MWRLCRSLCSSYAHRIRGCGLTQYQRSRGVCIRTAATSTEEVYEQEPQSSAASPSSEADTTTSPRFRSITQDFKFITKAKLWQECGKEMHKLQGDTKHSAVNTLKNRLRFCEGPLLMASPTGRVNLAQDILKRMEQNGVTLDVNIYNIMLRIYNANDHTFVPSEFLEEMERNNVVPNVGTFHFLIEAYCLQGNVGGAMKLLEYMKSLDKPLSEKVYASLVTGHSRAGDMKAAQEVITAMKANHHIPHNTVYSSLMCAYAERGDIEAIKKLLDEMHEERLLPSSSVYIQVMNTLSKSGHESLLSDILELIQNREWISSELYSLAFGCLCRKEVVAGRILLKELASNRVVKEVLLSMYIIAHLEKGNYIADVFQDLESDIDFNLLPKRFYTSLVRYLMNLHHPVVVKEVKPSQPPEAGALAPHPLGEAWAKNMLYMCTFLTFEDSPQDYYYPVLARYCSDVNLEDFMATLYQMMLKSIHIRTGPVKLYTNKIMSNANTSMDAYISTKMAECESDSQEFREMALFKFLYYCHLGKFEAAQELVQHFEKDSSLLAENSTAVVDSIKSHFSSDVIPRVMQLLSSLHTLPTPPDLQECVKFCSMIYLREGGNSSRLIDLLDDAGLDVTNPILCLTLMSYCKRPHTTFFIKLYSKVMESKHKLETKDYLMMFKAAVKTSNFRLADEIYYFLPADVLDQMSVRPYRLISLCHSKERFDEAMELLDVMIDAGQTPHIHIWQVIVRKAFQIRPELGPYVKEKMESCGLKQEQLREYNMELRRRAEMYKKVAKSSSGRDVERSEEGTSV